MNGTPGARGVVLAAAAALALLRLISAVTADVGPPRSDEIAYQEAALRIADGLDVAHVDRPLGYPAALAVLHAAIGPSPRILHGLQALLGIAAAGFVGLAARRAFDPAAGRIALLLGIVALHGIQYDTLLLNESPFMLLWAISLACLSGTPTPLGASIAGAALGIAYLVKPASAPLAVGILGWLSVGPRFRPAGVAFLGGWIASALLAAAALHAAVGAPLRPVPTLGVNLYLGNNPEARRDGGGLEALPDSLAEVTDPVERNRRALASAAAFARDNPGRTITLAAVRIARIPSAVPGRFEWSAWEARRGPLRLGRFALPFEWTALLSLAAVGATLAKGDRSPLSLFICATIPYVLVLAATFVQSRFKLPLILPITVLAGRGLSAILEPGGWRRYRGTVAWVCAAVAAASVLQFALSRGAAAP